MAYFYLDDSKHHRFGFSLAAFVICDTDPTEHVRSIFTRFGYDPEKFEYKSSAKMLGDEQLQALRDALRFFIGTQCKIAVCVVDGDKRIGPASLKLLSSALSHPRYEGQSHRVFFDEGLFQSPKAAADLAGQDPTLARCVRISRKLGSDFARSRARVSREAGQPFHDHGQAGRQGS